MADDLVVRAALKEQGYIEGNYECTPCMGCNGRFFAAKMSVRCRACAAIRAYLERDAQLAEAIQERDSVQERLTDYYDRVLDLEDQLAAMTAERREVALDLTARIARLSAKLTASEAARDQLRKLVDAQAEDEGLWFVAHYASEAYLQQELRKLHAAIGCKEECER